MNSELEAAVAAMPLVDHHVHSVFATDLDAQAFGTAMTEASDPPRPCMDPFDSQLGFAIRRDCAPVLDLPTFASSADYLQRRTEMGTQDVTRRFLTQARTTDLLVDGGYATGMLLDNSTLAELAHATVHRVVRLESIAEQVVKDCTADNFLDALHTALNDAAHGAIAFKTVAAYRCGLDFDPAEPELDLVKTHAAAWIAEETARLTDSVIIRHLVWWALKRGLPLQVHTGFGDPDLNLAASNPLLLQELLHRTSSLGTPVMLLHCYPFHREAGYLAHVFPHVFLDVGLTVNHLGTNSVAVVRETLELAPFGKVLYSSDAWGLPELVYLGAILWRKAITTVLDGFVADEGWPVDEAVRIARMIGQGNAVEVYRLESIRHEGEHQ